MFVARQPSPKLQLVRLFGADVKGFTNALVPWMAKKGEHH